MLRRALAVAFAAASLALVPATASATPEQAPVQTLRSPQHHYATTTVLLTDGRTLQVSLMEYRSASDVVATLSVGTYREVTYPCPEWLSQPGPCTVQLDNQSGSVELAADKYDIDRTLGGASVTEVGVPVVVGHDFGTFTPIVENRPVSVVFTGTGSVSRGAHHGGECPLAEGCQAISVDSSRAAEAEISYNGETASGAGSLFRGHSVYAASPKFDHSGD